MNSRINNLPRPKDVASSKFMSTLLVLVVEGVVITKVKVYAVST